MVSAQPNATAQSAAPSRVAASQDATLHGTSRITPQASLAGHSTARLSWRDWETLLHSTSAATPAVEEVQSNAAAGPPASASLEASVANLVQAMASLPAGAGMGDEALLQPGSGGLQEEATTLAASRHHALRH